MSDYVILAAHNEEKYLGDVLDKIHKHYSGNILVVSDGSKDKTNQIATEKKVQLISYKKNRGKGFAMRIGCAHAISQGATRIVLMDSDDQHDPIDIPLFLHALNGYDIVFGYRAFSKDMPFVFRFGNFGLRQLTSLLFGINLRDTQCGYRAFRSNVFKKIIWKADDYFLESEVIAKVTKHKLKQRQIEIRTVYKDAEKGTTVFDGIKIATNMVLLKYKHLKQR